MSARLARNWWAVGLRGLVALLFAACALILPISTVGTLVLLFAVYVAADGIFAILSGAVSAGRGERWWTLIMEGLTNLAVAGFVLIWPAIIVAAVVPVTSGWAVVTGALMLAAASRLATSFGRWILGLAGALSCLWGIAAAWAASAGMGDLQATRPWLVAYAVLFGGVLIGLAVRLRERQSAPGTPSAAKA
jgi:uncharacterized membrane protein HdeD (DUF308 family)